MGSLWSFLSAPKNQKTLSWLGGGLVVVIAGLWAAFVYLLPPKDEHGGGSSKVEASCGSAAVQGTMIGSSITTGGASSTATCPAKSK
jgi:hypothetical protein